MFYLQEYGYNFLNGINLDSKKKNKIDLPLLISQDMHFQNMFTFTFPTKYHWSAVDKF